MKTTIKTQQGKRYTLVFDKNPARPTLTSASTSPVFSPAQVSAIFTGAKPESHRSWSLLWQVVKPAGAKAVTQDADIVEALIETQGQAL